MVRRLSVANNGIFCISNAVAEARRLIDHRSYAGSNTKDARATLPLSVKQFKSPIFLDLTDMTEHQLEFRILLHNSLGKDSRVQQSVIFLLQPHGIVRIVERCCFCLLLAPRSPIRCSRPPVLLYGSGGDSEGRCEEAEAEMQHHAREDPKQASDAQVDVDSLGSVSDMSSRVL